MYDPRNGKNIGASMISYIWSGRVFQRFIEMRHGFPDIEIVMEVFDLRTDVAPPCDLIFQMERIPDGNPKRSSRRASKVRKT